MTRIFLLVVCIFLTVSVFAQSPDSEMYGLMLDSIDKRLHVFDSTTIMRSGKVDPVTVSDSDFIRVVNKRKSHCNFLVLMKYWPLEKEDGRIKELVGTINQKQYAPINSRPINNITFTGDYLHQFVPDKKFSTTPDCNALMKIDYDYTTNISDTVFYDYLLIQFTNILQSGESEAIAYAIYKSPTRIGGSRSFGFVFRKKDSEWYIHKMLQIDWDRW